MKKSFDEIKDTYCFHAFNSYSCYSSGSPRPCCVMQGQFDTGHAPAEGETIAESVNLDYLKNIRRQMLQGIKPQECAPCWDMEKHGMLSQRQNHNEDRAALIDRTLSLVDEDGTLQPQAVSFVDLTLGNICNLKCRSCNPWSSHQWLEEFELLPKNEDSTLSAQDILRRQSWVKKNLKPEFFKPVQKSLRHFNFLGGEPMMVKEHETLLRSFVESGDSKNITLSYSTNGMYLPSSLLEIWPHFQFVQVGLSIDAIGELAYYVRFPSDFKQIEANIEILKNYAQKYKNVAVQTHATLSVLNIHHLREILEWSRKQYRHWAYLGPHSYGYQNLIPQFNIVTNPAFLHMRLLPGEIKNSVKKEVSILYNEFSQEKVQPWEVHHAEKIKSFTRFLDEDADARLWSQFVENTRITDKFRKVDIRSYIPWTRDYF